MQPGNSKHGPVADEALAKQLRGTVQGNHGSRVEDWHDPEPAADDEPAVTRDLGEPDSSSATLRSELAAGLRRTLFPADRKSLLAYASEQHLTDNIRNILEDLPPDVQFHNVEQVWEQHSDRPDARRF